MTNSVSQFDGTNNNPNMYVITTTQISEDNDNLYTIGDPRSLTINNRLDEESFTKSQEVKDTWLKFTYVYPANTNITVDCLPPVTASRFVNGTTTASQRLAYYYPTDETTGPGSKENFIAPIIRVASSFGKIGDLPIKDYARMRCAAYQEAGRPAGRWRLPTKAELTYISTLSKEQIIPILFGNKPRTSGLTSTTTDAYYWTAHGLAHVQITARNFFRYIEEIKTDFYNEPPTNVAISPAVRCVYDVWYWVKDDGSEDIPANAPKTTQFYWGDKEKDNPQTSNIKGRWAR